MSAIKEMKDRILDNWDEEEEKQRLTEDEMDELKDTDRKAVRAERRMKNFQQFILYLIILIIFIWLMFFVVIGMTTAPNDDMSPNVRGGDLLFFYRIDKSPSANDIIVFEKGGTRYVGRVVAREGDKVEVLEKGGLIVNDNSIVESRIYEPTYPREGVLDYPVTVGAKEYFVLADAREDAEDSRYFGTVRRSEIKGTVIGLFRRTSF